jgi:hypothetical protein
VLLKGVFVEFRTSMDWDFKTRPMFGYEWWVTIKNMLTKQFMFPLYNHMQNYHKMKNHDPYVMEIHDMI